ncbi:hypothetical protein [Paenibacillus sp. N3.4]|uniref:hypothetical protein n=1 Tax=Paenibacillus sp. N3.4 TaxID=2603222 RepID=UPI00164F3F4F|nr:hypothetical protein [Paenibacillus sp. N3.4]
MDKSHYFDHVCNDTIPTPPDAEDVTATDMVSEAIGEIVDNVRKAFTSDEPDEHE